MADEDPNQMKAGRREQMIFAMALELADGGQRAAFVEKECGGDELLKRRVWDLLKASDLARTFLETPVQARVGTMDSVVGMLEAPGAKVGRYRLLEQIGEGGCGVVFMAEQEEPVKRRVALKVVKPGMDTRQVVARFEAERQTLALMEHPGIAKVFDGGTTPAGRPYFVMELVRGVPITEFCRVAEVSLEVRLQLFVQVCQAVQHAHQKGIIHRDLKPSNILVTQKDGVALPVVIDFGIAKALGAALTGKTVFTRFHAFIGTPAYASPEQAEMSSQDVDTRTDIYSLGVLLYELLTGETPFDGEELMRSGLDEMRRTLREVEPLTPSHQLQRSKVRREHAQAVGTVDRDLDWIVMKCLEKDRTRRYTTVGELAADVERYRAHHPVLAGPPSWWYRMTKSVRRNRLAYVTGAITCIALVAGTLISMSQASRARRAEREQMVSRVQTEKRNVELRKMVGLLELDRAEERFGNGDPAMGVAYLAALLERDSSNVLAASRLASALYHRSWILPSGSPIRHGDRVSSVSYSPDGKMILSSSWDRTAGLWEAETGKMLLSLPHDGRVMMARFSPDGRCFMTAGADGLVRVWEGTTQSSTVQVLQHGSPVLWAEFAQDGERILSTAEDGVVRLWNWREGRVLRRLEKLPQKMVASRIHPGGRMAVTGGEAGAVLFWDLEEGTVRAECSGHAGRIQALATSGDGQYVASGCSRALVYIWNAVTGAMVARLDAHRDQIYQVAFSPDSRYLATMSHDGTARIWAVTNGFPVGEPFRHQGGVVLGAFSPDGKTWMTSALDITARLWDFRTGEPVAQPIREMETILSAAFHPDGSRLVTGSWDWKVQVWQMPVPRSGGLERRVTGRVMTAGFHPTGQWVLAGNDRGQVEVLDAERLETVAVGKSEGGSIEALGMDGVGGRVWTGSGKGEVVVWGWDGKGLVRGASGVLHAKAIRHLRVSRGGGMVATASEDGTARLWDGTDLRALTPPLAHSGEVLSVNFDGGEKRLVTASADNTARVWDVATGVMVGGPFKHMDHVQWAEFDGAGGRVVTASTDNHAAVWDVAKGQLVAPPMQHVRIVLKAVFSPEGGRVLTGSMDNTARIWDAATGQALTPPLRHPAPVSQVAFTPDGTRIMTGCWDGSVRFWDAETGRPQTEWLKGDGFLAHAEMDVAGKRVLAGSHRGYLRVWEVPRVMETVPGWFLRLAEATGGVRVGARGSVQLVDRAELDVLRDQVEREPEGPYVDVARRLLRGRSASSRN